jgi:Lon protease-like protein
MTISSMPLFPLNSVLFPGMPLTLHIFEERYKLMIGRCVAEKRPFGVLLLQQGTAEYKPGEQVIPYLVGCSALITQVQPVGMGRMNILAIGQERFRVTAFDARQPYLQGDVEVVPFTAPPLSPRVLALTRQLNNLVEQYAHLLSQAENARLESFQLPSAPLALSFLAASLLKSELDVKQRLLEMTDSQAMLEQITRLYRKEVALTRLVTQSERAEPELPFSLN